MTTEDPLIEVRRSARRRRTVSAYRDGDRTIVLLPARMSRADEREWVAVMVKRLADQERRRAGRAVRSDGELSERAATLSKKFLDGRAQPGSVRWVTNQVSRWGSCTPAEGSIRLSTRLRGMPAFVVDYVLVHELAHLLAPGHGPEFHAWVDRYPQAERARGYLLGVTAHERGSGTGEPDDGGDEVDDAPNDAIDEVDYADHGPTVVVSEGEVIGGGVTGDGELDGIPGSLSVVPPSPTVIPGSYPAIPGSRSRRHAAGGDPLF